MIFFWVCMIFLRTSTKVAKRCHLLNSANASCQCFSKEVVRNKDYTHWLKRHVYATGFITQSYNDPNKNGVKKSVNERRDQQKCSFTLHLCFLMMCVHWKQLVWFNPPAATHLIKPFFDKMMKICPPIWNRTIFRRRFHRVPSHLDTLILFSFRPSGQPPGTSTSLWDSSASGSRWRQTASQPSTGPTGRLVLEGVQTAGVVGLAPPPPRSDLFPMAKRGASGEGVPGPSSNSPQGWS